ncbi:MaoC family dehydratase [Achromobacter denitrificans]
MRLPHNPPWKGHDSNHIRDRFLERRRHAQDLGRHRPRRASQNHSYTLTLEAIQKYCRVVDDMHPLYFDEAYALKSPYKGLIAPPAIHILLMFACTPTDDWMRSPGTVNAGQSWSYNIPARPGDVIRLEARALDKFIRKDRLFVVHDNVFFNQNNEVICSGRGWTIRPRSIKMTQVFDSLAIGQKIEGAPFSPTRESIRAFCEASLDYNPLHLDDNYMQGDFDTNFGGIIMHGMNNFGVITRMLTDWLYERGGVQRRLETRWKSPVKPGDTITPLAVITATRKTEKSHWATLDVQVLNQRGETVAAERSDGGIPR